MAINLVKYGVAGVVGVVDEVLERKDREGGKTEFKGYRDWARVGALALGLGIQAFFPKWDNIGEGLGVSATPLVIKSLATVAIKPAAGQQDFGGFMRRIPAETGAHARDWAPAGGGQTNYRPL